MIKALTNPCTRCGQERILLKQWVEETTTFNNKIVKVTRALNVCPDPECQKLIDKDNAVLKQKRDKIKFDREEKLRESLEQKEQKAKMLRD